MVWVLLETAEVSFWAGSMLCWPEESLFGRNRPCLVETGDDEEALDDAEAF
jgi:hypothetical protein